MVKFSFIITLYNDEKYIGRCLDSILSQSYKNYEVIIINDGSTDESLKICEKYQSKNSRINIYNQKNKGVCNSRNRGIELCSGDYSLFVDSDDLIEVDTLKYILEIINKFNNPDLITFDYKRLYENGDIYDEFSNDGEIKLYDTYSACKAYLLKNRDFSMVLWRRCYKNSLLKKVKFEEGVLPEDLSTAFFIYSNSKNIVHISKSLYVYFIKNNGLTIQKKQSDFVNLYNIVTRLKSEESDFFKNDNEMINRINSIYMNYLMVIYSNFYFSKKNSTRKEYLKLLKNDIKINYSISLEKKTICAYCFFRINKLFFSIILKKVNSAKIKGR